MLSEAEVKRRMLAMVRETLIPASVLKNEAQSAHTATTEPRYDEKSKLRRWKR